LAAIETLARHKPFFTAKVSAALREAFLKTISGDRSKSPSGLLSAREREIIQLLAEGKSNKEVAGNLGISIKTVETHRATIMRKLGVNSIVELVHYAVRNKIIST
jgi:DNA-binding NarL/FixJ family response regulator